MAENTFPFMSEDWAGMQEAYWKAWADMARLGPRHTGPRCAPTVGRHARPVEARRLVSPQAPDPVRDFYGHLIDEGKAYLQLTENLLGMFSHAGQDLTEWRG